MSRYFYSRIEGPLGGIVIPMSGIVRADGRSAFWGTSNGDFHSGCTSLYTSSHCTAVHSCFPFSTSMPASVVIVLIFIVRQNLTKMSRLALNLWSFYLSLLNNWDYNSVFLLFFKKDSFLFVCVCTPHVCRYLWRTGKGTGSHGCATVSSCETPTGVQEPKGVLWENRKCWDTSPAPRTAFLKKHSADKPRTVIRSSRSSQGAEISDGQVLELGNLHV